METKFLDPKNCVSVPLVGEDGVEIHHLFTEPIIHAINVAIAAQRPLLLRGEPGVGKSQLARAAAKALGRAFVSKTAHARTEPEDLLWTFDAVERLAEAQVLGAQKAVASRITERLQPSRFVTPEAVWWVFDRDHARRQLASRRAGRVAFAPDRLLGEPPIDPGCSASNGSVLLIDEIDKADSSVPNGLLEAFGHREFTCPQVGTVKIAKDVPAPLIVITTNEERVLPDAFLRRCFVLHLELPSKDAELTDLLRKRGRAHVPAETLSDEALAKAIEMLIKDRKKVRDERGKCPPGQAEFLDLIRAVAKLAPKDTDRQISLLQDARKFAFDKHPPELRS